MAESKHEQTLVARLESVLVSSCWVRTHTRREEFARYAGDMEPSDNDPDAGR